MDSVMLPLVWASSKIDVALEQSRLHRRSGVVRSNIDDTYTLFYLSDLSRAKWHGLMQMEQVIGGHSTILLDAAHATVSNLDLVRPYLTQPQFETFLKSMNVQYAVAGVARDMVMIVTLHESQTDSLSSGGFECTGTPQHLFPDPDVADGQLCPLRPECINADGSDPTIRPRE